MPPSASESAASVRNDQPLLLSETSLHDVIVAGIEVEALETTSGKNGTMTTRISLVAGSPTSVLESLEPHSDRSPSLNRQRTAPNGLGPRTESFDSVDEIPEDSNEARLLKRVAEGAIFDFAPERRSSLGSAGSFDETEQEYMGVLDRHLQDTDKQTSEFAVLDNDILDKVHRPEDSSCSSTTMSTSIAKQSSSIDDLMEQLITIPCCECTTELNAPRKPRSVLRSQKRGLPATQQNPLSTRTDHCHGSSKSVAFKNVEILEFPMTLGIHPSATTGPPVMLDWEAGPSRSQSESMDQYEKTRIPRRSRRQLKLTLRERHGILVKDKGFTFEQVKAAWQEALTIRKQRRETLERGLALMKVDEVWESTCRKFNRVVDYTFG